MILLPSFRGIGVEGEKQNSVSNVVMGGSRNTAEEVTWRRPKSRFGSLESAILK
jgi:hypothetical protein